MRSFFLGLTALALGSCDRGPMSGFSAIAIVEPPLLAHELVLPTPFSSEADEMGFAVAVSMADRNGQLAVLETGNDRIVLFRDRRQPSGYIGAKGSGPGELLDPLDVATWRDRYAVTEAGNGRVSVFDTAGRHLQSFSIPNGFANIGYGPDGTLWVNAYDGRNYLLKADDDGTLRPFGERPWDLYPDRILSGPPSRVSGYVYFVVTNAGTVIVYDPVIAGLVSFSPDGRRSDIRRLPEHIAAGLVKQSEILAGDFGGLPGPAPAAITDLSVTPDGRLLLLFPNTGAVGLLVKLPDWTAREIRWGPGVNRRFGGANGVLRGDTLYRLSVDDLRLFLLTPE